MNENIQEAFIILIVGMITVFAILSLVVFTGQILIKITNRFAPPQSINSKIATPPIPKTINSPTSINKKKLAAIIGTVEHLTNGTGKIEKIEKL